MVRQGDLNRPLELGRKRDRDRCRLILQRLARRSASGHRVKRRRRAPDSASLGRKRVGESGRLARPPHLERAVGPARGRANRLERQMLRRRHKIVRRERPHRARGLVEIALFDDHLRLARKRLLEQVTRVRGALRRAEHRTGRMQLGLRDRPAFREHRDPVVACLNMANCAQGPFRIAAQFAAGRRQPRRSEQHVGQANVAGEAPRAIGLGRPV